MRPGCGYPCARVRQCYRNVSSVKCARRLLIRIHQQLPAAAHENDCQLISLQHDNAVRFLQCTYCICRHDVNGTDDVRVVNSMFPRPLAFRQAGLLPIYTMNVLPAPKCPCSAALPYVATDIAPISIVGIWKQPYTSSCRRVQWRRSCRTAAPRIRLLICCRCSCTLMHGVSSIGRNLMSQIQGSRRTAGCRAEPCCRLPIQRNCSVAFWRRHTHQTALGLVRASHRPRDASRYSACVVLNKS